MTHAPGLVKFAISLVALLLAGCAGNDSASIVFEVSPAAISPDGTLREPIGIETLGGVFTPLLAKGCRLPCVVTRTFATAEGDQDQILLKLFRGYAVQTTSAHHIGTFRISGIAPMAEGEAGILVEFRADLHGITLTATDKRADSELVLARVGAAPPSVELVPFLGSAGDGSHCVELGGRGFPADPALVDLAVEGARRDGWQVVFLSAKVAADGERLLYVFAHRRYSDTYAIYVTDKARRRFIQAFRYGSLGYPCPEAERF